jgi:hypothetical protein
LNQPTEQPCNSLFRFVNYGPNLSVKSTPGRPPRSGKLPVPESGSGAGGRLGQLDGALRPVPLLQAAAGGRGCHAHRKKILKETKFIDRFLTSYPGADPTTAIRNASAVKIYNATSSLVRFENKNIFLCNAK